MKSYLMKFDEFNNLHNNNNLQLGKSLPNNQSIIDKEGEANDKKVCG